MKNASLLFRTCSLLSTRKRKTNSTSCRIKAYMHDMPRSGCGLNNVIPPQRRKEHKAHTNYLLNDCGFIRFQTIQFESARTRLARSVCRSKINYVMEEKVFHRVRCANVHNRRAAHCGYVKAIKIPNLHRLVSNEIRLETLVSRIVTFQLNEK